MERYSTPFLVRYADNRRKIVDDQKKKNFIYRKTTVLEQLIYNILPVITTSTILAPLNRIKVLLQVNKPILYKQVTSRSIYQEIITNQGYLSLWKGNAAYSMKILAQMFSRVIFYDRIKYYFNKKKEKIKDKKYMIPGISICLSITSAVLSSSLTFILSYPFDLAFSRLTSDMTSTDKMETNSVTKAISLSSNISETNRLENRLFFLKYYKGCSLALVGSVLNFVFTIIGYEIFSFLNSFKKEEKSYFLQFVKNFGASTVVSIISGSIIYPVDTAKRIWQVSGTSRYSTEFFSIFHALNKISAFGILNFYHGYSFYLMRSIPFSFLQYNIFLALSSSHRRNSNVQEKNTEKELKDENLNTKLKDN